MIYLAAVDAVAVVASLVYLVAYARIADWRDHVAVNAWCGGLAAFLLAVAGGLYVLGHYRVFGGDDYLEAFAVACAGFTVVVLVWTHRAVIVLTRGKWSTPRRRVTKS